MAAIMFTDVVGYTALGQMNESLALSVVDEQRKLLRPIFTKHGGREIKTMGDAFLVEFASALSAVTCAYEIQESAKELNASLPHERQFHLRVGVHLGDIIDSQGDVSGDAVNVASRIESLADSGGICLTRQVYDQVQNKFQIPLKSLGIRSLKNVRVPMELFKIVMPWETSVIEDEVELERHRIAVLPLKNMSPDPDDEYFADGMTEELIMALSSIRELTIIARTSVMQYKNSLKRAADVGRELKTGTIIEGSVRKVANTVRIAVQMIDAATEGHLWVQNYDRQMDDIFGVQSEIAEKVANELRVNLIDSERHRLEKRPTENIEAYTLYLKGHYYWNERTKPSVEKGIAYLQRAVLLDPNFSLGYSDLADAHVIMADYGMMPASEAHAKAREYATTALKIDPSLSQPHAALATVHERNFRWAAAEREFKLAIKLNPNNATAHHWYALNLSFKEDRKEDENAIHEWRMAKELDPLSMVICESFGYYLVRCGHKEEGLEMLRSSVERDDGFALGHRSLVTAYLLAGMNEDALMEAKKLLSLSAEGVNVSVAACAFAKAGLRGEAVAILDRLLGERDTQYVDSSYIAIIYAALGDEANSLEWMEKAVREKAPRALHSRDLPVFDFVRDNPRFRKIYEAIGLG